MSHSPSLRDLVRLSDISEEYVESTTPGFIDVDGELRAVEERVTLRGPDEGQALHAGLLNVEEEPLVVKYDVEDRSGARTVLNEYFDQAGPTSKNKVEQVLRDASESLTMTGIAGGGTVSARLPRSDQYDLGRVYEDLGRVYHSLEVD